MKLVSIVAIGKILRKSRKAKEKVEIFSVTLKNIKKALKKLNQKKQPTNPKTKLLQYYHDKLDIKIFSSEIVGQKGLSSYRPGINHAIKLKKDKLGKKRNVLWGPLYNMTKEELLVLRKILTNHLEKGWIRVSKLPAGALVFFVRKPGGGLRFCVDYRKFNEITKKNRTSLPLITKTLRIMAKAE
jgi:hypothetical protein